jgi:hypothetical protein
LFSSAAAAASRPIRTGSYRTPSTSDSVLVRTTEEKNATAAGYNTAVGYNTATQLSETPRHATMGERSASQEEINQQAADIIFKWVTDEGQRSEDSLKDSLLSLAGSADVTNCGTKTVDASDGESRAKRSKLSDDRNMEPQEGGTLRTNESLPKTLKEVALYFVEHCRDDETRDTFGVALKTGFLELKPSESKDTFRERIEGSDEEAFHMLLLDGWCYSDAEKALRHINVTMYPTARLVKEINCVCSPHVEQGDDIPNWEESFVVAEDPSQLDNVNFPVDMSKGAALVVTGESGSGKSWFCEILCAKQTWKA